MKNDTNPLVVFGAWDKPINRVVKKIPNRGSVLIEAVLILRRINKDTGIVYTPFDLEEIYQWIFMMEKVDVTGVHVYRVEDNIHSSVSSVNLFLQITSKVRHANQIQKILMDTPVVVLSKLVELYPQRYTNTMLFSINGNPTVITRPKEKWEMIVEATAVLLTIGCFVIVFYIYRKALQKWYHKVSGSYRMKRRQVVCDEYSIPYNMWFNPKEVKNDTTVKSFDTAYGEIHLVDPLLHPSEETHDGFIVASQN